MSQGASHYPIVQFISRLMQEYEFSRVKLVQALGYRNLKRGLRRLEPWMENGDGFQRILKQIARAYPGHADGLEKAVAATRAIKEAEAEAAWFERCKAEEAMFVPFVHAEGESTVPNGITIFGVTGGHERWTTIRVSQTILNLPIEDQLAALPELMLAYRRRYDGQVPFFGQLTGFKFVRLLEHFQFDAEGRLLEHVEKPLRRGTCSIQFL